jgi:hypothetical protein
MGKEAITDFMTDSITISKKEYPKIVEFANKLVGLSKIFNDDSLRYLYLASLISADALILKEEYENALNHMNFIKRYFDLIDFKNDDVKKEVKKYLRKGLRIVKSEYTEKFNND